MTETSKKKGQLPFWLGGGLLLVILVYSVYWFWMAGQLRTGVHEWIADHHEDGYVMTFDKQSVGGYPFRFVLTFDQPAIANTVEGWSWKSEQLKLVSQSYNFYHLMAFAPGESTIKLEGYDALKITPGKKSAASFIFDNDYNLKRFGMSLPQADVQYGDDYRFDIHELGLGLEPLPDNEENLKLKLNVDHLNVVASPENLSWLGPKMDELIVWIEVENFYQIVRGEIDAKGWRRNENQLHLRRGEIDWGPLDAATRASVRFDEKLDPYGFVGVHLERQDELRSALDSVGLLTNDINFAIATIAYLSQNDNFATVEVRDRTFYAFKRKVGTY